MLARLWWKEFRMFGPVWLVLGLAAIGLQWVLSNLGTQSLWTALFWAVLYAFAVGSVAFAGERESGNLAFLDALPVDRRLLWAGKASFALITTVILALAFGGIAWLVQTLRSPTPLDDVRSIVLESGILMFEAIGWGLLWSSLSRNPLLAGAMAVVSVGGVVVFSNAISPTQSLGAFDRHVLDHGTHLAAGLLALAISAVAFVGQSRFRWSGWESGSGESSGTIEARSVSVGHGLAWQTWREGRTTLLLFGLVGIIFPAISWIKGGQFEGTFFWFLAMLGSLMAGLAGFGTEYQSGHRRFLVQHGVAPGAVWSWKVGLWGLVTLAFLPFVFLTTRVGPNAFGSAVEPASLILDAFAVGVFCGMAIRRRITAALVAVIVLIGIGSGQMLLRVMGMIPAWSLTLTPLILLGISRCWVGDWLLDRGGFRPWLRLGVLTAVPFGLLGSAYIAHRAYGVPDIGRQFDPATVQAPILAPDRNAAEGYKQLGPQIRSDPTFFRDLNGTAWFGLEQFVMEGSSPEQADVERWREMNQAVIDRLRTITMMPRADFGPPRVGRDDDSHSRGSRELNLLSWLLLADARSHRSRGDLAAAWEDILALFRMSHHLMTERPSIVYLLQGSHIHHSAVGLAFEWLGDARQTPETARRALADLDRLPGVPDMAESLRAESSYFEQILALPTEDLGRVIYNFNGNTVPSTSQILVTGLGPAWERERARRVGRRMVAETLAAATVEPWRRDPKADQFDGLDPTFGGSPLVKMTFPGFGHLVHLLDQEVANRRALEQVAAIKVWQFEHGGEAPPTLASLVPGILARLPIDPYSGKPFGYIKSEGQAIRKPMASFNPNVASLVKSKPGQTLLYSVGPDRHDDGGKVEYGLNNARYAGDFLFAVP